jgi:hypothetical protein
LELASANLDGDGSIEMVAIDPQSHNARIYWNTGVK